MDNQQQTSGLLIKRSIQSLIAALFSGPKPTSRSNLTSDSELTLVDDDKAETTIVTDRPTVHDTITTTTTIDGVVVKATTVTRITPNHYGKMTQMSSGWTTINGTRTWVYELTDPCECPKSTISVVASHSAVANLVFHFMPVSSSASFALIKKPALRMARLMKTNDGKSRFEADDVGEFVFVVCKRRCDECVGTFEFDFHESDKITDREMVGNERDVHEGDGIRYEGDTGWKRLVMIGDCQPVGPRGIPIPARFLYKNRTCMTTVSPVEL